MTSHTSLDIVSTQTCESFLSRVQEQEIAYRYRVSHGLQSDSSQAQMQPTNGLCLAHMVSFFFSFFLNFCQHLIIRFHIKI